MHRKILDNLISYFKPQNTEAPILVEDQIELKVYHSAARRKRHRPVVSRHRYHPPSSPLEPSHPLFGYPLNQPSEICRRNGGGRWSPQEHQEDPDALTAVRSPRGRISLRPRWEVLLEEEEKRERQREKEEIEGVIIIDGAFKLRQKPVRPGCLNSQEEVDALRTKFGLCPATF
ncbi:hypothetical protein BDP27DRAFT_1463970 [Rhodocollybia butyracea]|uniref:Uncharacterized protein n=1 Tax=Rhodocollybia butyracea TaxID=206335 RepID=A0A9P5PJY0_9AGAR|nr:hypothetical protein BDP27DRAFT_1463970 [Rhodocollybia butyracea]